MTLEQLSILNTVVEEGSFRAAADKLWKTQPAVVFLCQTRRRTRPANFERGHRKTAFTDAANASMNKHLVHSPVLSKSPN